LCLEDGGFDLPLELGHRVHGVSSSDVTHAEYLSEVLGLWRDLGIACLWFVVAIAVAFVVLSPLLISL
jgi:hypothetical protein